MTESAFDAQRAAAYGAAVLRLTLGAALLAHGLYLKVFVFTMAGTVQFFEGIGLPGALAWAVMLLESVGGIALLLGVGVRVVALALVPVLVGAAWAHWDSGWLFENPGGGWEYPAFWSLALIAQALLGPGALRLPSRASARGRARVARRNGSRGAEASDPAGTSA
jgi:putative oxidoreductase